MPTSPPRPRHAGATGVHDAAADARAVARRAADSETVDYLARWGLAARGAIYLVVAMLAVALAAGRRDQQPTSQGALLAVAHEPLGAVLLVLLASGLGAQACWRVVRAVVPPRRMHDRSRDVATRLADVGRAVFYGALAGIAVELLLGRKPGAADGNRVEQDWTGRVLHWPGGRVLVVAVGVSVVVAGGVVTWRGLTGRFGRDLQLSGIPPAARSTVSTLAKVGITARSIVAALVGAFLVEAAVTFDPARSTGIDGALSRLRHHTYGTALLVLVAAGLAAYGLYSFAEARYGEVPRQ